MAAFDWVEWKRHQVVMWAAGTATRRRYGQPPLGHPWWWTPEWQREVDVLLAEWAARPDHWSNRPA